MGQENSKLVGHTPARRASAARRLSRITHLFSRVHNEQAEQATPAMIGKLERRKSSKGDEKALHRKWSIMKTRVRNVENFVTVWLDPHISILNKDYYASIIALRKIVNMIQKFRDVDECILYLNTIENDKVLLIVSGDLGQQIQQIMPQMHEMVQLESIYIFSSDNSQHEKWSKEFRKIKGLFTDIEPLCIALDRNIQQLELMMLPISIFSSSAMIDLHEIDQMFILSQLLRIILSEIDFNLEVKEQFTDFCRAQYAESNQVLLLINEFEQEYDPQSPLWWYSENYFTYSILNKALRVQDIEIIMKMAFFIRDLNYQIEKLSSESNNQKQYTVYRGQSMAKNRFEELNNSKNGLFSFNNFVSAIMDRDISLKSASYDRDNPDLIGVLFQIEIDPSISSVMFTRENKENHLSEEIEKVLFSMQTVFRIGKITQMEDCVFQVNLTLINDNDPQLARIIEHIYETTREWNGWHRLGKWLIDVGDFEKAEAMYLTLLRTTPGDKEKERAFLQYQLGCISEKKGNLSGALSRYEQCLDVQLTYLSANDPELSPINTNIGAILHKQGDFQKALEYFKFSFGIDILASHPDQLKIATDHSNIGMALFALGNYIEALDHFDKTLQLHVNHFSPNHQSLINIHHNLAKTYEALNRSKEGVEHAEHAVDIACQTFGGRSHPVVQKHQEYLDTLCT